MKKSIWLSMAMVIVLCASMILPSCKGEENPASDTGADDTTDEAVTEYVDAVPAIDCGGQDFVIVSPSRSWAHVEMTSDALNAEVINDAIFRRTVKVNNRLNVNLVDNIVTTNVTSYVQNDIISGNNEFDLLLVYPHEALSMYQRGLYVDQNQISTLNFDNPWWEASFNEEVNVGNVKYVTYNQSNLILYSGFYLFAFNKSLIEANGLESPYELVEQNRWTWDTAYSMMQEIATDMNQDGVPSAADGDILGLVGHVNHSQNLILSSGETIAQRDADGTLTYSGLTDRYRNAFEKYTNYFIASPEAALAGTNPSGFLGYTSTSGLANYINYFNEGKSLFLTTGTSEIMDIRNSGVEYGIVVVPKYEADQQEFITPVYKGVDGFAVPHRGTAEELAVIGTVMETLGAYSYNNLIDIHISNVLHYRAANDPVARDMITLAYSNPMIDVSLANNFGACSDNALTLNVRGDSSTTSFDGLRVMISAAIRKAQENSLDS